MNNDLDHNVNSCAIIKFKLFDYEFDDFDRFYHHIIRILSAEDASSFKVSKKVDAYGVIIKVHSNNEEAFMDFFNEDTIRRLQKIARRIVTFPPSVIIDKKHCSKYKQSDFSVKKKDFSGSA